MINKRDWNHIEGYFVVHDSKSRLARGKAKDSLPFIFSSIRLAEIYLGHLFRLKMISRKEYDDLSIISSAELRKLIGE